MMPFQLQEKELLGFDLEIASIGYEDKWKKKEEFEPTSVLHMRRSPSPPTSASTLSSSLGGSGVVSLQPETPAAASELQPIPGELDGVGLEDWESMMSGSAASLGQEQSLLRWISGDADGMSFGLKQLLQSGNSNPLDLDGNAGLGIGDQGHGFEQFTGNPASAFPGSGFSSLPPGMMYQQFEPPDEKPQLLMSHQQSQHPQNPNLFMPLPFTGQQENQLLQRRHNTGAAEAPFPDPGHEFLLRKHHHQNPHLGFPPGPWHFQPEAMKPGEEMAHRQGHQLEQLYQAAEQVGIGNFSHAQAILARLNHQLSPAGNPLHRAAFYFKEALQLLLHIDDPMAPPPRTQAQFDFIFKMGAYKLFSQVSPLTHFINFTCNQALLEALNNSNRIHIFDLDIGLGAQWASFMQELPVASSLKITAFASPSTHHPLELELMRQNLTQFAINIGLNFDLEVINFNSFDQSSYPLPNKAIPIAVNFPIWAFSDQPSSLPSLLSFIKNLSPKIMVSLDRGCDRTDLPFPQHLLNALQSYSHLFKSLDSVNAAPDTVSKIERFLIQPKIESTVLGRLRSPETMPFWRTLFASAGFSPVPFSNFTEAQAECVVRRAPVRGFHVEKRQASLALCWQSMELVSASAWRC